MKLSAFFFVLLRIGCDRRDRRGQYRLARLAQSFGAEATLEEVVAKLGADYPYRYDVRRNEHVCRARVLDMEPPPRPPDLPPEMLKLKVIRGGKA